MTIERQRIEIRGTSVEVVRKDIKNLHVGVYPPSGRVRVAVPLRLDNDAVRLALVSRLGWIRRRQEEFRRQERQSQRECVSGESHYLLGRRYRLNLIEGDVSGCRVKGGNIELRVRWGSSSVERESVLQRWYRQQLREMLPPLVAKWEEKARVRPAEVRIRRMKTRWGSCNAEAGRLWLNLELVKKPVSCVEYVLVHEMVHLHERRHDDRFVGRMDQLMPGWRLRRDELNRRPLAHEEWTY